MLDATFVYESLRRRWWVVALITVLFCAIGLASMVLQKSDPITPSYTAEAAFYVSSEAEAAADNFDVSLEQDEYLAYDARRIVLNDSVAGKVRRTLGEDIVISTPTWQNDLTKVENKTRFIFVDATAADEQTALKAANMAAELAAARINADFEGLNAFVSDEAAIKTASSGVANFGADALMASPITQVASSISVKKLVIFAGIGFIIGVALVLVVDYCRRRIRSAHDVERLTGVNVIETVKTDAGDSENYRRCAGLVDALAKHANCQSICLIGWPEEETPSGIIKKLDDHLENASISGWAGLSTSTCDTSALAAADSAILVIGKNEQAANELDFLLKSVTLLDLNVLGALYLDK